MISPRVDRLLVLPGAPVFFGELRKGNRRRILLDAASKVVDSRIVSHASRAGAARDQGVMTNDADFDP